MSTVREDERENFSHAHADKYLQRERRAAQELARDMGHEVTKKFDRLLQRDIIRERRERAIDKEFGSQRIDRGDEKRHYVMITMRSAPRAAQTFSSRAETRSRLSQMKPERRKILEKRAFMADFRRSNEMVLERLEEDAQKRGAKVEERYWLTNSIVTRVDSQQLEHLTAREDVQSVVVLKLHFAACLDVSRPLIQADAVETTLGFDGTGVVVAVIDTGIDISHRALRGAVTAQQDFTGTGVGDANGHGTHCAGIVGSRDTVRRGIAPGSQIQDFKMMDANGAAQANWAVSAIQAAVTAGVDVASNSWGFTHANGGWTDADGTCVLCTAADAAVAAGVVFCVAAGNEDNDSCATYDTHLRCPGIARNVITVAASNDSDNMAGFSSIGPTPDGRAKPDITAPGVGIVSARASGTSLGSVVDDLWTSLDGTSQACPHVAGVAALLLDENAALTPANVLATMTATAVNIGATANEMGAGRVDALAAVNAP
jgi:serine protease AprX